jgi:hypothetical protein
MFQQRLHAYIEAMRADHRQLHGLLGSLTEALQEAEAADFRAPAANRLVEAVESLREHLAQHFAQEEEGGYLEEALVAAPHFAPQADLLLAQHAQLLAAMEQLLTTCQRCRAAAGGWACVADDARRLLREIRAHETGESRILERAFNLAPETAE